MRGLKEYTNVIWDWNGTLFNDVKWCFKILNTMLAKRGLRIIDNISEYKNIFCFPIIEYYIKAGFSFEKEPFDEIAKEFILLYHSKNSGNCSLYTGAEEVLKVISNKHISQVILSASEIGNLLSQVNCFNIKGYFNDILGISNIYANSKIEIGLDYIKRNKAANAVLIGDTVHDYETAKAMGTDCILISAGHQSRESLLSCNVPVLNDITDVLEYIL